jgi:hypothetical protein
LELSWLKLLNVDSVSVLIHFFHGLSSTSGLGLKQVRAYGVTC